ncbi:hypothetical protein AB0C47_15830 [Micromonospora taraxaci]|uniref:hypothetical protein n=1 Tax=Micromonospora taraxaci TaxID=1316803 RepID=UPI0033E50613
MAVYIYRVVRHIGARQLYALDKRVIHELYKKLLKGGGKNCGPLSATTVRIVTSPKRRSTRSAGRSPTLRRCAPLSDSSSRPARALLRTGSAPCWPTNS